MNPTRVFTLLVVDDDPLIHQSFRLNLPSHWRPVSATKPDEIPEARFFHAAFVDMHLSAKGTEGLQVLQRLNTEHPTMELIAMSGDLNRPLMESSLKAGAQRFLPKPLQKDELLLILQKIEALWDLRQGLSRDGQSWRWIGEGAASRQVLARMAALKGETGPVLIEGESGTGKEVAARLLHLQEEEERPFVSANVAAIPENLFESELFGHIKGAFTGADRDRAGLCENADGGDLFLDEIETLTPAQQAKLLRFLENGEVRRVGATTTARLRCRVVAATNRPLDEMVRRGEFREDLFYRLKGHTLSLPPLRERREDIPDLARFFVENVRPRRNKTWTPDGLQALQAYAWPGNVRELKRVCEQLCLVTPLPILRADDVQAWLSPTMGAPHLAETIDFGRGLTVLLEDYEKKLLTQLLATEPDVEKAALILKMSRSNLYKKIKDHQLETN